MDLIDHEKVSRVKDNLETSIIIIYKIEFSLIIHLTRFNSKDYDLINTCFAKLQIKKLNVNNIFLKLKLN